MRRLIAGTWVFALLISIIATVAAAGSWYWYDVTVPKFGGSTTTYNQTKQSYDNASWCSYLVGADYKINGRLEFVNNDAASEWVTDIGDHTLVVYPTWAGPGQVVHMRLATQWWTPVDVQAQGYWSPDNPGGKPC